MVVAKQALTKTPSPLCRSDLTAPHKSHPEGGDSGCRVGRETTSLLLPATKAGCPIQAVLWLEWDTQPLPLVQGVVSKLSYRDYLEFPMYQQQRVGAPFKPYFGLSGIHSLCCW